MKTWPILNKEAQSTQISPKTTQMLEGKDFKSGDY